MHITHKRYPEYETYKGPIHHTISEVKIPTISGLLILGNNIIGNIEETIKNEGGVILETAVNYSISWFPYGYIIETHVKWYLPGEFGTAGNQIKTTPASLTALIVAAVIVAILAVAAIYYWKRHYDAIEEHGYPSWYETIGGNVVLAAVGVGVVYLIIKAAPYLVKKIEKK